VSLLWFLGCSVQGSDPGLPPEPPVPVLPRMALSVDLTPGLSPGEVAHYSVIGAQPTEIVDLYGSFDGEGAGPCPLRFMGLCLDLAGKAVHLGQGIASARGVADIEVMLSQKTPLGSTLSVQAVIRRGLGGADSVKSAVRADLVYMAWESGLKERPPNPTCLAPAAGPLREQALAKERAFGSLSFHQPVEMVQPPGDGSQWWLVEKGGLIWRFEDDDETTTQEVVLDLTGVVDASASELGLLGLAFHPDFALNGEVYVDYTSWDGTTRYDEVVRYTSPDGLTLDPASATFVLRVEDFGGNHNAGKVLFGPDGYLYISYGDGGGQGDPYGNGQDTFDLLGCIARIDVDSAFPYAIPPDNPFADGVGGLPEIYAWGFRNPWRFSFDRVTGDLWVGDVGQYTWEEVNRVERGGNYGWDWREGLACWEEGCETVPGLIDPVLAYDPGGPSAVIGGYVYRGSVMPELYGTYVFADYHGARIRKLDYDSDGHALEGTLLYPSGMYPSAFAEDLEGELYAVDYSDKIWRLVAPDAPPSEDPFPKRLSETGCVDPNDPTRPVEAMLPFVPASPLWSDGASKDRWLAIPDGTQIAVGEDGDFDLPVGSVVMKEFRYGGRRVETRLFVRHADGSWAGYPYVWDEDETDAVFVDGGELVQTDAGPWRVPSTSDCVSCHTEAAGRTLGLELAQLNGKASYPGGVAHQLVTLDALGMLTPPLGLGTELQPDQLDALPSPGDVQGDVEDRARAYLHANCAGCHRPGGTAPSELDLRYSAEDMVACGIPAITGDGALLIDPGSAETSVLVQRMRATDVRRMPPLGTEQVDAVGTAVVSAWIDAMTGCP
jgi:uncharacterized repeat protein (TIGR03806 family)